MKFKEILKGVFAKNEIFTTFEWPESVQNYCFVLINLLLLNLIELFTG